MPRLEQDVDMVRHEAVRQNREAVLLDALQKLLAREFDALRVRKGPMLTRRARSHVISRGANVGETGKSYRTRLVHAIRSATAVPQDEQN